MRAIDALVRWLHDEPAPRRRTRRRRRAAQAARRRFWTAEEDERLRREYPDTPTADLARALGRTLSAVYIRAREKLGLSKSAAYLASPAACRLRRGGEDHPGRATQFKAGQTPANKGLRRPGWAPGRMAATQFKPGHRDGRWMPIGSTRLIDGYVYRKVSDVPRVPYTVNWKPEHLLVWQAAHGPVPAGHALAFQDRDRTHVHLENLECITRGELMRRNSVHNLPAPLPQVIQLLGAINRKIRRRERAQEQAHRPAGSPLRNAGAAEGRRQAARGGNRPREGDRGRCPSDRRLGEG